MPRELKAAGKARGGHQRLAKNVFDRACFTARNCTYVEVTMKQFCLGIIVAIGLTLPAVGQSPNALIGTWKFNAEKSSANAPLARSAVLTFTGEGQNLRNTAEGIDAQGNAFKITFMHIYDGKPHPSTGNPNYDSTAYTRVDSNNVNYVRFKEGKIAEIGYITVSQDGKTYTAPAQGIAANGQQYHSILVYDRQ
jgi:hypothetical protein